MTDRLNALVVVLDRDIREDDAQMIKDAIGMMKYVISVDGNVADINFHVAETRARMELGKKIINILNEKS